jgi:biopolymer transport protein ExbD
MARREIQEINAGSMADIAFLLLIFWLVTTTIDSDEGIQRQLPPPIPKDQPPPPEVRQRNVYVVLVNAKDQLLVESRPMNIRNLKKGAREFLIANGDGLQYPVQPEIENFPVRVPVNKVKLEEREVELRQYIAASTEKAERDRFKLALEDVQEKLSAIDLLGSDYQELPGSALISMQNDNNTTYNMYIQVQNELQAAVNELRDELSVAKFGISFDELKTKYERSPEDKMLKRQIYAIRSVYPQRISEAEPKDAGEIYK